MATIQEFNQIQFKIAKILEANLHPNADRLLVLKVDVGGLTKEVVAGIAQHYTCQELVGKLVVVVDNLEPAVIRGVTSNGMILATQDSGGALSLVIPERPVACGSSVH